MGHQFQFVGDHTSSQCHGPPGTPRLWGCKESFVSDHHIDQDLCTANGKKVKVTTLMIAGNNDLKIVYILHLIIISNIYKLFLNFSYLI